jgi:hypothetical protein
MIRPNAYPKPQLSESCSSPTSASPYSEYADAERRLCKRLLSLGIRQWEPAAFRRMRRTTTSHSTPGGLVAKPAATLRIGLSPNLSKKNDPF